jgi:zinc protease
VREILTNKMQVVIVRSELAPVVTIQTNIMAGELQSPAKLPGMAHAQEHMAFRGCRDMTADQTAAIYAQLDDENNADTQQEVTEFYLTVPVSDLDIALEAQAKCLQDVEDSKAAWSQERGALEEDADEILSDPEYQILNLVKAGMFTGTPYVHDALGTKSSFENISADMLKKFYQEWYSPSNVVLVIVGNVERKISDSRSAILRLLRTWCTARTASRTRGMDCKVQGPVQLCLKPGSFGPCFRRCEKA